MADDVQYDAIVVGGGPIGAHVAKLLSAQNKRVLILEAGRAVGTTWESYRSHVDHYYTQTVKQPNSPYPPNPMAPSPMSSDLIPMEKGVPDLNGYQVEIGRQGFGSTYLRALGGTSLHWLGTTPRHFPNDFRMQSRYGVGVDWPISYDEIQPYYRKAEWSIGVSSNKGDQEELGIPFEKDYDFPMERIPMSYADQVVDKATRGMKVKLDGKKYPVRVSSLPQARNSIPREGVTFEGKTYEVKGAVRRFRRKGEERYVEEPGVGYRCEGNAACIPICPVQAKYTSLRTLADLDPELVTIRTQCVATRLQIGENGRIAGVEYIDYGEDPKKTKVATATVYALAAHAVENAKLLLASGAANSSDQVGRNLMDHPFYFTWALAPKSVGAFRGPGQTSGIETLRDGDFRSVFAAARIDLGNWGWDVETFPPNPWVAGELANGVFGRELRAKAGDILPRQVRIGFDLEQLPEARNRVTIDRRYKDALGCFRPVIDYRVSDYTWEGMAQFADVAIKVYEAMGCTEIGVHPPAGNLPEADTLEYKGKYYHFVGAGHHVGTHRMGVSRTDSVVNRYCKSWDHSNLYLVGCGSLPTTATANPTLTALATTFMAVEDMLYQL